MMYSISIVTDSLNKKTCPLTGLCSHSFAMPQVLVLFNTKYRETLYAKQIIISRIIYISISIIYISATYEIRSGSSCCSRYLAAVFTAHYDYLCTRVSIWSVQYHISVEEGTSHPLAWFLIAWTHHLTHCTCDSKTHSLNLKPFCLHCALSFYFVQPTSLVSVLCNSLNINAICNSQV